MTDRPTDPHRDDSQSASLMVLNGVASEDRAEPGPGDANPRKALTVAVIIAAAALVGSIGGSLATSGLARLVYGDKASVASADDTRAIGETMARLETEIGGLRAAVDHAARTNATQFSKIGERIDKVEKAQVEPAAKLAKITDTLEKMRTAATPAPQPPETTGSIPASKAAGTPPPPVLSGWILRDVADGGATVEGRTGIYEVFPGDPLPGLNRVEAIRRDGGRWVVVTRKGLIVGR